MKNHLILGNWNALCDSCGRKFKALDLQKRWDGLMVCKEDWEQRHPSDFLRVQKEKINVEFSRPYPAQDNFLPQNLWVNPEDIIGIPDQTAMAVVKIIPELISNIITTGGFNSYSFNEHELDYGDTTIPPTVSGESVTITEIFNAVLGRFLDDSLSLAEALAVTFTKAIDETIPVGENLYFAEEDHALDSVSLSESQQFVFSLNLSDSVAITESLSNSLSTSTTDVIGITETVIPLPIYNLSDSTSVAESSFFAVTSIQTDSVAIAESLSSSLTIGAVFNGAVLNSQSLG